MKRLIPVGGIAVFGLLLATIVAAQTTAKLVGQVMDSNGKPYAGVSIIIKKVDTAQASTLKADKEGRFSASGLPAGSYEITVPNDKDQSAFTTNYTIVTTHENDITINLKELLAKDAAQGEEFKHLKAHFEAAVAAMTESADLRKQLSAAPSDQKGPIRDKLATDYQTAITEFQTAEKGVLPKDVKNHAVIWSSLGQAYGFSGHYDDAASSYQKAIELQPTAGYYSDLSTALANQAVAQTDPAVTQQKLADAGASCDKATALDPTATARCWKNLGIVLNNKGDMKDAIAPFQKATQAEPKDAQAWFLLGGALTGTIDSKQVGDKMTYAIPPGTTDAYQKCIDADPNGPYAPQAKQAIDGLVSMGAGQSTVVGTRAKKK